MNLRSALTFSISCAIAALVAPTGQALAQKPDVSKPAVKRYGQGLGRLLTTETERAKLDELRFNVAPPKTYDGPAQLEIQGLTERPGLPKGQSITIWIDRRPYFERDLPDGLKLVRDKNGTVTGITSRQPGGKLELAKIGDFISRPQTKEEAQALMDSEREAKANGSKP
jgi:hypothetical protein